MKIEKINDRQIRCTLTKEDLAKREIRLSELAYGSEKAKMLFQDMMQMAAQDFGFEAENMPLVIEAIPISMDSIILIITKVEDPEELDTRFAHFSPEDMESHSTSFSDFREKMEGADDILGLIRKLSEAKKHAVSAHAEKNSPAAQQPSDTEQKPSEPVSAVEHDDKDVQNLTRFYLFHTLDDAIRAGHVIGAFYDGPNTLYKNPENGHYYLLLKMASSSAEQFNKVCNILSEYALSCKFAPGMEAHFTEHMEIVIADHALQDLYQLS